MSDAGDRRAVAADWPPEGHPPPLAESEVHVWCAPIDGGASVAQSLLPVLAPDERRRAERFRYDRHREAFVCGRGTLRHILSRYLECDPAAIEFAYNEQGKPALQGPDAGELSFNLSHSGGVALLAVAARGRLGVDVEFKRQRVEELGIVERFFSPGEVTSFLKVAPESQRDAFFTIWTRKEAYIKALGGGLSIPLDQFDVSFLPDEPPRILRTYTDEEEASRWTLLDLSPSEKFAGALAIEGPGWKPRRFRWRGGVGKGKRERRDTG